MLSVDNMVLGFRRAKTDVRRQQIVETTLALLADSPLDKLSTRQIAKGLGISQPALFRHFASRDALLLSVIEDSTGRLGQLVEAVVQSQGGALDKLAALGAALLRHLDAHPGCRASCSPTSPRAKDRSSTPCGGCTRCRARW